MKKRYLIIIILVIIHSDKICSQTNNEDCKLTWVDEIGLLEVSNEDNSSFIKRLAQDSIICKKNMKQEVVKTFVKKGKRVSNRNFDIKYEEWIILEDNENIIRSIRTALSKTIYEKPPKVILVKDRRLFIIETWGAVYRGDLYKIKNMLMKHNKCEVLLPLF